MSFSTQFPRTLRSGMTLVETLVVISIFALATSIVVPAIVQARMSAEVTKARNKLRQIALATAQLADIPLPSGQHSMYYLIMDRLKLGDFYSVKATDSSGAEVEFVGNRMYENPTDPSLDVAVIDAQRGIVRGNASFAYNALVAFSPCKFPDSVPDGLSTTIVHSEHYARCGSLSAGTYTDFEFALASSTGGNYRRSTIADKYYGDFYPISDSAIPSSAFQLTPKLTECDTRLPQATHAGGLLVAMGDCSVHTIGISIRPQILSSLMTPAGGEADAALP